MTGTLGEQLRAMAEYAAAAPVSPKALHDVADQAEREAQTLTAGDASDGYHTHNELYAYRMVYNAALFNEWARTSRHPVVKSRKHSDGEPCFGGGWFIVVATLPAGQVSNHYEAEHWDMFQVPAVDLPPTFDGHTPAEALERLRATLAQP
jgi:hypothetical protein